MPQTTAIQVGDERLPAKFWSNVDAPSPAECWPWIGTIDKSGYARMSIGGITLGTHRHAYLALIGPADGLLIDHLCHTPDNCEGGNSCLHRRCVNPAHLDSVTYKGNAAPGRRIQRKPAPKPLPPPWYPLGVFAGLTK